MASAFEKWYAKRFGGGDTLRKAVGGIFMEETTQKHSETWDAALEEAMKLGEDVARQVGGQFWETHMLNTGLLKFLNRLRELKEQK